MPGNRIWRVETPDGPVVQKLYDRRTPWPREELRALLTALVGRKTSPRALERRATEQRLLAQWSAEGFDVPRELSAEHPGLAGPRQLVLEWVGGPHLLHVLKAKSSTPRPERDRLLSRFASEWRRRHDLATERDDPSFIQEHGSLAHVLVVGERLVTYDLEQGYRRRGSVFPALAKEVADTLRTLRGRGDPDHWKDDLRVLVASYGDRDRLQRVVDRYLRPGNPLLRLVWAADRLRERLTDRRGSKSEALAGLEQVLHEAPPPRDDEHPAPPNGTSDTPRVLAGDPGPR